MEDSNNQQHQEHLVDEFSGCVITQKKQKFLGMSINKVISLTVLIMMSLIVFVCYSVDDRKVQKMAFIQGTIAIICALTYGWFHSSFEKNTQKILEKQKQKSQ